MKMKLALGSKNKIKLEALAETIRDYPLLAGAEIETRETDSGVSGQPNTLEETIAGAINRAEASYRDCDYSFGIESGFMKMRHTKTGYMELSICAIHDGKNMYLGFSPAFECPSSVIAAVKKGQDLNDACSTAGLTTNPKIGEAEGIIGILTKGRVTRKDYTKQAIIMALIHLESPNPY